MMKNLKTKEYLNVFIFFWAVFILTNCGFDTSEGGHHYQIAEQIIRNGHLSFTTPQLGIFVTAPNGRIYAAHEIGNTIFLLPTALINIFLENLFSSFINPGLMLRIKQFVLSFQAGIYSAITATIFFAILRDKFRKRKIPSFLATCCLAFTTYFWPYSRNLFDGVLCSTLLMASIFFLFKYKEKDDWKYLIYAFFFLGFGFITRIPMILAIMASFVYLVRTTKVEFSKSIRELLISGGTLIPFFLWQSWYNHLRTGVFYLSGVQTKQYAANNALDGKLLVGLQGLLFSPGKSLFVYAPLLILSVFLFEKFYKEYKRESIYVLSLGFMWLLLHAKLRSWYGAWGWGPRHFITIVPVLFLPFAVYWEFVMKNIVLKLFAVILGAFGFLLSLSSIISNWHFRMSYAFQQGRLKDEIFVWSFWNNQAMDMIKTGLMNAVRIFSHLPNSRVIGASLENEYASNTLNIWLNSFLFAGVPWYLVTLLGLFFVWLISWSIKQILSE